MAHMVPHVEIEATGNAALGGCCSRFSDDAVVIYKDDRFELREYNVSCCTRGDGKRREFRDRTINELDRRFNEAYGVDFREVSEAVDIDVTEGITFLQFKAIRDQALHDKIFRHYGVTLKEAVDALHIDIDPVKGLSVREIRRIEKWAATHNKKQEVEYDPVNPVSSLEEIHRIPKETLAAAFKELGIDMDPQREFSPREIWDIEMWMRRNTKQQATEYDTPMSPMPSLEELPAKNMIGPVQHLSSAEELPSQNELRATESQRLRLAGLVQRAVMLVVNGLTPRQVQAMRERREAESQREPKSVEERKPTGEKKEFGMQIEVDV